MGKVMFGLSVSLDGFIADKNDDPSLVFAWMGSAWEHFNEQESSHQTEPAFSSKQTHLNGEPPIIIA